MFCSWRRLNWKYHYHKPFCFQLLLAAFFFRPAICAKVCIALSIFFTYPLQFYVVIDIFTKYTQPHIKEKYQRITQLAARTVGVCCCGNKINFANYILKLTCCKLFNYKLYWIVVLVCVGQPNFKPLADVRLNWNLVYLCNSDDNIIKGCFYFQLALVWRYPYLSKSSTSSEPVSTPSLASSFQAS